MSELDIVDGEHETIYFGPGELEFKNEYEG